jgi:hypothetical protein
VVLEKLIVCVCRHTLDMHDAAGCHGPAQNASDVNCACPLAPKESVERVIDAEVAARRTEWLNVS